MLPWGHRTLPLLPTHQRCEEMERRSEQTYYNWAVEVAQRMKGVNFPIDRDTAASKLRGVKAEGKDISETLGAISFPVDTPADLLHQISQQVGKAKGTPGDNWAVNVARASNDVNFPLSKEEARSKLKGIDFYGRSIDDLIDKIKFPVDTPADLMHQISMNLH